MPAGFSRRERRAEEAKRRQHIDPSCPLDLIRDIDVTLAASIVGRRIFVGETLGQVVKRECPSVFALATRQGFILSFDLPENTHQALARGLMAYSIKRTALN